MFLFVREFLREPPGHTPPAFLFLSSTMSKSREEHVLHPNTADANRCRPSFERYRPCRQLHQGTSKDVGAASGARPSVRVLYEAGRLSVKLPVAKFLW